MEDESGSKIEPIIKCKDNMTEGATNISNQLKEVANPHAFIITEINPEGSVGETFLLDQDQGGQQLRV
jgi:hypothetical protein